MPKFSNYRIKTKKEFVEEYGNNFISEVNWNPQGKMDYLFGRYITEELLGRILICGKAVAKNTDFTNMSKNKNQEFWYIFDKMITNKPRRGI